MKLPLYPLSYQFSITMKNYFLLIINRYSEWEYRKMKSIFFFLFFLTTSVLPQWKIQNSGVNVSLRDVFFVDSLYGLAVGDSGVIIATSDGGENWLNLYSSTDIIEFKQVQFLDRENGFVAGNILKQHPGYLSHQVILLRTTNGGLSWKSISSSFDSSLTFGNIKFLNSDTGWVSINNSGQTSWDDRKGILLKTNDGGSSWTILMEENFFLCEAFDFNNDGQGFSFWSPFIDNFDNSYVYNTPDDGITWDSVGIIKEELVKNAKLTPEGFLWAIGFKTSISTDGGKDWATWNWFISIDGQKRFIPTDIEIKEDKVFLLGDAMTSANDIEGRLYKTNDSGGNWLIDLQMLNSSFFALSLADGKKAWIVGENGLILYNNDIHTYVNPGKNEFPQSFYLGQNFPNPFNPSTTIEFSLTHSEDIKLEIFDLLGRKVKTLLSSHLEGGLHSAVWNGSNEKGFLIPSGIYVYRLTAGSFHQSKKMILIR